MLLIIWKSQKTDFVWIIERAGVAVKGALCSSLPRSLTPMTPGLPSWLLHAKGVGRRGEEGCSPDGAKWRLLAITPICPNRTLHMQGSGVTGPAALLAWLHSLSPTTGGLHKVSWAAAKAIQQQGGLHRSRGSFLYHLNLHIILMQSMETRERFG